MSARQLGFSKQLLLTFMYRVVQTTELLFLWCDFSSLDGNWNRVLFNTDARGTFCDDTGVENITWATFKCSFVMMGSSSDNDLHISKRIAIETFGNWLVFPFQDYHGWLQCIAAYLILRTPFSGDFNLAFNWHFRFGVLLPMSIISISCVRPVLRLHASSAPFSIWCVRLTLSLYGEAEHSNRKLAKLHPNRLLVTTTNKYYAINENVIHKMMVR